MRARGLDLNKDWKFGNGTADYVTQVAEIGQDISTNILCFLGDCFFDSSRGIDWVGLMQSKNIIGLLLAINAVILNVAGVSAVLELSFNIDDDRNGTIQYQVVTIFSQNQSLNGSIPVALPGGSNA